MTTDQAVLETILLGTERRPFQLTAAVDGPLAEAIRGLTTHGEGLVLSLAAITGAYARAGVATKAAKDRYTAAPLDPVPECRPEVIPILRAALLDGKLDLLAQAAGMIAEAGRRIPAVLLPEVFEACRRMSPLREPFGQVVGDYGRWLASLNSDWRSIGTEYIDWSTASVEDRITFLSRLRRSDPAQGLALLQSNWSTDTGPIREKLIQCLKVGLSVADEPFLDSALDDRATGVRSCAAQLLARLPDTAYSGRMMERAHRWVHLQYVFGRGHKIEVDIPEMPDPAWARDVESTLQGMSVDMRVSTIVSAVPVHLWEAEFKRKPEEIVRMAHESEWGAGLLRGFVAASAAEGNTRWTVALLALLTSRPDRYSVMSQLPEAVAKLDPATFEAFITPHLNDPAVAASPVFKSFIHAMHPGPMSERLARGQLVLCRRALEKFGDAQTLNVVHSILRNLAMKSPPSVLPDVDAIAMDDGVDNSIRKSAIETANLLQIRRDLRAAVI